MTKSNGVDHSTDGLLPIESLSVRGFKSIDSERTIDIRPLTILAGANSSGKSSVVQPLLLLKQTLEASYDPGPLLLNGPNVAFTRVEQFLCKAAGEGQHTSFSCGLRVGPNFAWTFEFRRGELSPLELDKIGVRIGSRMTELREGRSTWDTSGLAGLFSHGPPTSTGQTLWVRVVRNRCQLVPFVEIEQDGVTQQPVPLQYGNYHVERAITHTIHVPGLRGNPQRTYPLVPVSHRFPGTFENYAASVIAATRHKERAFAVEELARDLAELGLTSAIEAMPVDDTQVELRVGRQPGGRTDLVSIADVGFGVSQVLPVVVALLTARPGQLVYLEQPEIHLHPKAQHAMARLLARAAERGVRVLAETHSSILLLGIQSLVARGELDPAKVRLHWFTRNEQTGLTEITPGELDRAGSFGDWPEDFDDVTLRTQQEYLDAAEKHFAHEP